MFKLVGLSDDIESIDYDILLCKLKHTYKLCRGYVVLSDLVNQ